MQPISQFQASLTTFANASGTRSSSPESILALSIMFGFSLAMESVLNSNHSLKNKIVRFCTVFVSCIAIVLLAESLFFSKQSHLVLNSHSH